MAGELHLLRRSRRETRGAEGGTLHSMARLKLTVILASGARIGPGKAKLLESIRSTG
jgi:hypothetical protein